MLPTQPFLVTLVLLIDALPFPEMPQPRGRGRPRTYSDRLIVKALVIMIVRRLYSAYSLLAFLDQPTPLTVELRRLLVNDAGQFPSRRTWERRLAVLPDHLPGLVGCLGRHLVSLLLPWRDTGRAVAIDSTPLRAKGAVWHKKQRDQGIVPHSGIDTEAQWSRNGHHGWWYGWKRHLACTVAAVWIPLAAEVTVANIDDAQVAPQLLDQLPAATGYVLGDTHYHTPALRAHCQQRGRWLVATRRGPHPHTDDGVDVRRIFHKLRSQTIEPFNGLLKNVFEFDGQLPVRGRQRTRLFVVGAILVYQLILLYQWQRGLPLGQAVKPLLRAA